jgi:ATP-binding protein involved in chromosome partitioning
VLLYLFSLNNSMSINKELIRDALLNVNHPANKTDIVQSGIVNDIIIEKNKISIHLKYPKSKDPFSGSIKKSIERVIQSTFGERIEVEVVEQFAKKIIAPEFKGLEHITNIIAVASGKGGVGKSTVAVNLAIAIAQTGAKVALLDADIYGPSIPKMFAAEDYKPTIRLVENKEQIIPLEKFGVFALSLGFFVNPKEATIWRGPMATSALKQIIGQTSWGTLDFLIIDLPPGTGDIHLTLVQEMSITGAIIVSTPQQVALADVVKGINMFRTDKINVPILGLVENMAWFTPIELPDNKYYIFGKEGVKKLAEEYNIPLLGEIPIIGSICEDGDRGKPSALNPFSLEGKAFSDLAENVIQQVKIRNEQLPPTKKVDVSHKK